MTAKLVFHEWLVICLLSCIFVLLAFLALRNSSMQGPAPSSLETVPLNLLQVKIEGAVAKPGSYQMPLKAKMKDLLEQAEPLAQADLSQIKLQRRLYHEQSVIIPEKVWMTIYLEGAVKEAGPFQVLRGTRCSELVDQLELLPEADIRDLRKKRHFLKPREVVKISFKKKSKKG